MGERARNGGEGEEWGGEEEWGIGEAIAPNILGVSFRFKQNCNIKLLNSDSPFNLRVVC